MGAAFLGTGGGGDPYIGRLMAEEALKAHGPVELLALEAVPDEAFIVPVGNMGAPTVLVEKIPGGDEPRAALEKLERHVGKRAFAVMPFEAGGVNSTLPLRIAAERGLPVVDADGMGRAFPELQMETFHVYGVPASPVTIVNEHGDSVVIEAHSSGMAEWIARGATIRMGGQTSIAMYGMDGKTAKRVSIPGTMSLILDIGRTMRQARERHRDPFTALIDALKETHYGFAEVLFGGKIVDVRRETRSGFALGTHADRRDWKPLRRDDHHVPERESHCPHRENGSGRCSRPDMRSRQRDCRASDDRTPALRSARDGDGCQRACGDAHTRGTVRFRTGGVRPGCPVHAH